jgi:predicted DNA-binding transcriptional regulator YafY
VPPDKPEPTESDRRLRHNFRLARLLKFLQLILGRGQWNPKNLAAELECSDRTLHRMRETLELAGVPLFFSREENAYRVRPDFRFPTLHLDDDEALGQATATAVAGSDALHLGPVAAPTTRKLIDTASVPVRRLLEDAARLTEVLDLKIAGHALQRETIRTAQWALLTGKMLSGKYRSPYEPGPVAVKLHPYRVALVKQAWYLIARPDGEEQPRTYRIVRFQTLKLVDRAAVAPADFDLKAYFGNAWSVYRGDATHAIELRFSSDAAEAVLETTWHHTQRSKREADGSVTLTFRVDGLSEVVRWVVGWAGRVRVVAPAELRGLVLDHHRRAIAANADELPA